MARSVHIVLRSIAGLIAIGIIALALLAARLSAGPLSLQPLAPSIALLLETVTPFRYSIGDAGILWRDWERGLLVRLSDVHATSDEGDGLLASLADVAVSFSPQAIASGLIAPTAIDVAHGTITLGRGVLQPDAAPAEAAAAPDAAALLASLRVTPRPDQPLSYLHELNVRDLELILDEEPDADWHINIARAQFSRTNGGDLAGSAQVSVTRAKAEDAQVLLTLSPVPNSEALRATLALADARPSIFAELAPLSAPLAWLAAVDLPLRGKIVIEMDRGGVISQIEADLQGGSGFLEIPAGLADAAGFGLPAQRWPVQRLAVQGSASPPEDRYALTSAEIVFAPDAVVILPPPVDHRYPVSAISASATYLSGRLTISSLTLDVGGPRIDASATIDGLPEQPAGVAEVKVVGLGVDQLESYWPPKLAPGGYDWCTRHLRDGRIPEARARVEIATHDGTPQISSLDGNFAVQGVTVDYLPPMPPARNAAGSATVDLTSLRIQLNDGTVQGLRVRDGVVTIPDLDRDLPSIDINLAIDGPVRDAVSLIASPPLAYPQRLGIAPRQTSGDATVRLTLGFPLLAALRTDDIRIEAQVDLTDAAIVNVGDGIDVSNGDVRLDIDTQALHAIGRVSVAGMRGQMRLVESFVKDANPETVLDFESEQVPVERVRAAVGNAVDLQPYLVDGTMAGRVRAVVSGGTTRVDGNADFKQASLAVPTLQWSKPQGTAGVVDVSAQMRGDRLESIPKLSFIAPNLALDGSAHLDATGDFDHLRIAKFISGKSNVAATLAKLSEGGWDIMVDGPSLDLAPLLKRSDRPAGAGNAAHADGAADVSALPSFTLAADVGNVWIGPDDPVRDVTATIVHDAGLFRLVQMQGSLGNGSEMELSIAPASDQTRVLSLRADDAGAALRAFDLLHDIRGGRLQATGTFDDSDPAHPFNGRLRIKDYHVVGAPILARLLSVLALTGIRDVLTGRGLYFSNLDLPFSYADGLIDLGNGKAYGSALGLTVSGRVDSGNETLDLRGELVPFYAVNSAFGRIPLVGDVMTGGEPGGGVFSASYRVTGPLAEPDISVNPVSVLFPGFLRWIFETFEGWVDNGKTSANGAADGGAAR